MMTREEIKEKLHDLKEWAVHTFERTHEHEGERREARPRREDESKHEDKSSGSE